MKITVLSENTSSNPKCDSEHGLSLYIELQDKKILFDMGQSDLFMRNANLLDVDLKNIDFAVVSHGHYDHGGGLYKFLEINSKAPVYINADAFGAYYNKDNKYIGLDINLADNSRIIYTEDKFKISENICLYSCNEMERGYETPFSGLTVLKKGKYLPDDFHHEQYLMIEENKRKYLISGCSHKGILNISDWFRPDVLIGGFHFSKINNEELLKTYAEKLSCFNTDYYTCHCTGTEQYKLMSKYMSLKYISTGDTIIV